MSEADREAAHHNKIAKVKKFITENWETNAKRRYEAYAYLFRNAFDDIRKDFLTGVTYYKNDLGDQVPVENDIDTLKSLAITCNLNSSDVGPHLMRFLNLLERKWLIDIPAWDMTDRLKTLAFGTRIENVSQQCFYEHLMAWGAGFFARASDPYHQNHVLILRGPQGIGKDFFVKTILKALGPYFGTWTNSRDEREIIMLMERSLVMNIPEFDNTHQNEIAMLKALITKYQATFRSPYARKAQTVNLRTSFISSANVEYLLRDSTGNRRYLIFVVEAFDLIDKFDEFDSMQILAQFKWAFEAKFKVSVEAKAAMDKYIESQTPPPLEDQILEFWNEEIREYLRMANLAGDWVPGRQVSHIIEKLRKEFGLGRNHVTVLLNNRGCRARRNNGVFYRSHQPMRVVKNEAES